LNVSIPKLTNEQKETLSPYIKLLKSGRISLKEVISQKPEDFSIPDIEKRYSHINLIYKYLNFKTLTRYKQLEIFR